MTGVWGAFFVQAEDGIRDVAVTGVQTCALPISIEKDGLLARSAVIGGRFEKRAFMWQKKWDLVGDVRGLGGMCAIELVRNAATREPADTETKQIARYCYEHGLITITAGTFNNVIRILVPLVVTDEQFDEGLDVIEAALAAVAEPKHAALSGPGADRWAGGRSGR